MAKMKDLQAINATPNIPKIQNFQKEIMKRNPELDAEYPSKNERSWYGQNAPNPRYGERIPNRMGSMAMDAPRF